MTGVAVWGAGEKGGAICFRGTGEAVCRWPGSGDGALNFDESDEAIWGRGGQGPLWYKVGGDVVLAMGRRDGTVIDGSGSDVVVLAWGR